MGFAGWLRTNSEHYLLRDAQTRTGRSQGVVVPRERGRGALHPLWVALFVPTYRHLPWGLRHAVMMRMPGSHRRGWTKSVRPTGPAV
jgi:hypothetical protein